MVYFAICLVSCSGMVTALIYLFLKSRLTPKLFHKHFMDVLNLSYFSVHSKLKIHVLYGKELVASVLVFISGINVQLS